MRARSLSLLLALLAAGLTPSCTSTVEEGDGDVSLLLTDAPNDELVAFEVDVSDVTMVKADGALVSVLTKAARVDFVQLENLSDLIVGRTLPAGFYAGMSMRLDFSNAAVCLVGQTTHATVLDRNGNAITGTVDVPVVFPFGSRPRVVTNRRHMWVLDLDLEHSLTIDTGSNTVTFDPVVRTVFDPGNPKPVRTNGVLGTVDPVNSRFLVRRIATDDTEIGAFPVQTTPTTIFQIDGQVATGAAGLAALALQAAGAPRVFVQGALSASTGMLVAAAVETGAGVPGNGQDWVIGHTVARSGGAGTDGTLTVLGQSLDVDVPVRRFNTLHTVNVFGGQTSVLQRASSATSGTDALNVGQLVMAFGTLTGTALDAGSVAQGVVRMLPTSVWGIGRGPVAADRITLDLVRIGVRPINQFDFTVSGNAQADPMSYVVDVTGIDASGVADGSRMRAIGFVNPVDVGGDADFDADTIVDRTAAGRLLVAAWVPPLGGVVSATNNALTLDVSQALVKAVGDGFGPVVLTDSPAPTVVPALGLGLFAIVDNGAIELHGLFSTFSASLAARMANRTVVRVVAGGSFNPTTQTLSALLVSVVVS